MGDFMSVMAGKPDPLRGMKFRVSVPTLGILATNLGFSKVSGLAQEAELIEYREGDESMTQRKIPGLEKQDEVTLERGVALVSAFDILQTWKEMSGTVIGGPREGAVTVPRHDVHIEVLDRVGGVAFELILLRAWVRRIEYGDLDANASEVWLSRMLLVHEGLMPESLPGYAVALFGGFS